MKTHRHQQKLGAKNQIYGANIQPYLFTPSKGEDPEEWLEMTQDEATKFRTQETMVGVRKPRKFIAEFSRKIKCCFTQKRESSCNAPSTNATKNVDTKKECAAPRDKMTNLLNQEEDLLKSPCFYWPDVDSVESITLLENSRNGTFLVRKSSHPAHKYTLTYNRKGKVASVRLQYCSKTARYCLNFSNTDFPRKDSIRELIDTMVGQSIAMKLENDPDEKHSCMKLEHPLYRVTSLKEQCRARVITSFSMAERIELVENELPMELIEYLR